MLNASPSVQQDYTDAMKRNRRDLARSTFRVGSDGEQLAVHMAEHGYGVDDIMVQCRLTRRTASLLVLGV